MCACLCVCLCDKVTTAGHSKLSPHQGVRPLINVPGSRKTGGNKNNTEREGEREREKKNKRGRRSGGRLSQQILKVSIVREGFCLQRVFYSFCVVLYLRVSPSVLLLEVWGRRRNGRELSSQDPALLSASSPALRPEGKHKALMLTLCLQY